MKKIIITLAMAATGFAAIATPPSKKVKEDTFNINAEESTAKWHAKKVTGEHFGDVKFASGNVIVAGNKLSGGSFDMDMSTINTTDLTGEWKSKLDKHLNSDDFFSTAKFKTATLKIKSSTLIENVKAGDNNYMITADLTIKGITNEITFPAMIVVGKKEIIANADLNIDRTKYDIRYGSGKFFASIGDKAISDEFNIKVRVVAKKDKV